MQNPFSSDSSSGTAMYQNFLTTQNLQQQTPDQQPHFFGSQFASQQFQQSPGRSNFQIPIKKSINMPQGQQPQGINLSNSQPQQIFQFSASNGQEKSQLEIQTQLKKGPVAKRSPMMAHGSPGATSNLSKSGPSSASGPRSAIDGPRSSAEIISDFNMSVPMVGNGAGHNNLKHVTVMKMSSNTTPATSAADSSVDSTVPEFNQPSPAAMPPPVAEKSAKKQKTRETLPRRESVNITDAKNKIAALDAENAELQSVIVDINL